MYCTHVHGNIYPGVTVSDIRRDRISATQPNATNVCAVVSRLRSLLGRDEFLHPLEVRQFTYANIGHILWSNRVWSCVATYVCVYMYMYINVRVCVQCMSVVSRQIRKSWRRLRLQDLRTTRPSATQLLSISEASHTLMAYRSQQQERSGSRPRPTPMMPIVSVKAPISVHGGRKRDSSSPCSVSCVFASTIVIMSPLRLTCATRPHILPKDSPMQQIIPFVMFLFKVCLM